MPRFGGINAATPKSMQSLGEPFLFCRIHESLGEERKKQSVRRMGIFAEKEPEERIMARRKQLFFCAILCFPNVFVLPRDNLEGLRCKCIERQETSEISKAERRSNARCVFNAEREMGISKAEKQKDSDMISLLSSFILSSSGYIAARTWRNARLEGECRRKTRS